MNSAENQKAMEQQIRELEESLERLKEKNGKLEEEIYWRRKLVQESGDGIVIVDQHGVVFDFNDRFADMLGYSREEVSQLFIWDWDHMLSREQILSMVEEVDNRGHHLITQHRRKDNRIIDVELSNNGVDIKGKKYIFCICRDITELKRHSREREEMLEKLQKAHREIESLREILPLCSFCKKIRNDEGLWENVERYISTHSHSEISHSVCPECYEKHYSGINSPKAGTPDK